MYLSSPTPGTDMLLNEEALQRWSTIIGIITAIIGNVLISFALNIQRFAHLKLHEQRVHQKIGEESNSLNNDDDEQLRYNTQGVDENTRPYGLARIHSAECTNQGHAPNTSYLQSPYWWGGIFLMTFGEAGNFLAYGFAPASIVSPLGVVALISNCVVAPIILKENFRPRDVLGVIVSVAGAVTVVLSAKQKERKLGPLQIWQAITTIEFEIYVLTTTLLITILLWASPRYGHKIIIIDLGLVGLFGGFTALSTKGVASMLSSTLWRTLATPITYVLLIVLISTAVMQVKYINRALQRFDSTQVIPVQFVTFTLSTIVGSAVLYRDFEKTTTSAAAKFMGGCILTFCGVWLITSGRIPDNDSASKYAEYEDSSEEQQNLINFDEDCERTSAHTQSNLSHNENFGGIGLGSSFEESSIQTSRGLTTPRKFGSSSTDTHSRVTVMAGNCSEETPLLSYDQSALSREQFQLLNSDNKKVKSPFWPLEAHAPNNHVPRTPNKLRSSYEDHSHKHLIGTHSPTSTLERKAERSTNSTFHSLSRLLPGPLLSPLSGGLSGVAADSIWRSVKTSPCCKNHKLNRDGLFRTLSGPQGISISRYQADGSLISPLKLRKDTFTNSCHSLGADKLSVLTRPQSSRNALREIPQRISRKTDIDAREEAGPSRV
ncbi:BgTH12-04969 [Blumeria graminis f. sp. triticale]|uniref:BgTH12-04969 n=1 Tax=Blumeria graminis f. sp. triticale TaxID=1689686 RepID=A0A9W4D1T9_BLUGR|nr:BgTH12-04969 [Blumeria graminis f. sp. triticale]